MDPSTGARRRAVALIALAIAGQAAWLTLVDPDPWRAGLRSMEQLLRPPAVFGLVVLALHTLLLLVLRHRYTIGWRAALAALGGRWGGVAVLFVSAAALAAVTARPAAYPVHWLLALWGGLLSLLTCAAAGAELEGSGVSIRMPPVRFLAAGAAATCAILAAVVFDRIPHVPDEVVYLLQARLLAQGRLCADGLPVSAAWDVIYTLERDGCRFGIFPPGWPALLAIGARVGAPWIVNPILAGVSVLAAHRLGRRLYDDRGAAVAAALLATSPWFLYLGASQMSHTSSLLAAAIALVAAVDIRAGDTRPRRVMVGGIALGWLVLSRPFEGVMLATVIGLWLLSGTWRTRKPLAASLSYGAVAVAVGALMLPYNARLTGRALLDPITLYFDTLHHPGVNRLGFGADVGNVGWGNDLLTGHSPFEAVLNSSLNAHLLQVELYGWGFGSALIAIAFLFRRRWWTSAAESLPVCIAGVVMGGYALYWYSGADFGARYWSQLLLVLTLVTARWLTVTPGARRWRRIALVATLAGAPLVLVWRGGGKYRDYRGMRDDLAVLALTMGWDGRDLILIRGERFSDYSPGIMLGGLDPTVNGPLYVRDVGLAEREELRRAFPERRTWIVAGASLTDGAPSILEGPLPATGDLRPTQPPLEHAGPRP